MICVPLTGRFGTVSVAVDEQTAIIGVGDREARVSIVMCGTLCDPLLAGTLCLVECASNTLGGQPGRLFAGSHLEPFRMAQADNRTLTASFPAAVLAVARDTGSDRHRQRVTKSGVSCRAYSVKHLE